MREETKRRLERAIWLQRAKWIGFAAAILAAMAASFAWISADASVENVRVPATVVDVGPLATKSTQAGLLVHVTLADAKVVSVIVNQLTDPHPGDHVEITEHRHSTGRRTYSWK